MNIFIAIILGLFSILEQPCNEKPLQFEEEICVSQEEMELYKAIDEYRKSKGLPNIPLSKSLTFVAQQHCIDLQNNQPHLKNGCNLHSWSKKGDWSSCCYTPDHSRAKCMWDKPKEMTSYNGYGFEIATASTYPMNAQNAFFNWKSSRLHNEVVINRGIWKDKQWNAIGVGIYGNFAMVWFGTELDQEGEPIECFD